MFKNQLQELAQRSCFNLPAYACVREGPDHAPRFKASVNFNGELFESPTYSTTLRQAEHAAAEAALNSLSARGPSKSLTARVLDETGVYKNLLQETAHRAGLKLPVYTTVRSGPGHIPVFTSSVELAGMSFSGEAAKTKKQAEKNAAIAAWSALKRMPNLGPLSEQNHQENVAGGKWSSSSSTSRVIRRRDQQPRGRMQRPSQRDNNVNPSSCAHKLPWKFTDPFLETGLESKRSSSSSSFLSLLPPPPPRTASKMLPRNLPEDCLLAPLNDRSSQFKFQESPPPPPSSFRNDDYEWIINKISEAIKKEPIGIKGCLGSSSNSHLYGAESARGILDFSRESKIAMPPLFKVPSTCHNHMGVVLPRYSGAQRIAPAVQIRSVIPVCAAPPVRSNSNQSPSTKETAELASILGKLKL